MIERGISNDEVRRALTVPERTYTQHGYGAWRQVRQAGRIGTIVDPVKRHVITVVFRDPRVWLAFEATLDTGFAA